jgi:hypothetical protein
MMDHKVYSEKLTNYLKDLWYSKTDFNVLPVDVRNQDVIPYVVDLQDKIMKAAAIK